MASYSLYLRHKLCSRCNLKEALCFARAEGTEETAHMIVEAVEMLEPEIAYVTM